jgi:hypothetical protein
MIGFALGATSSSTRSNGPVGAPNGGGSGAVGVDIHSSGGGLDGAGA